MKAFLTSLVLPDAVSAMIVVLNKILRYLTKTVYFSFSFVSNLLFNVSTLQKFPKKFFYMKIFKQID